MGGYLSLKDLKYAESIDKEEQKQIKHYIDDLVFALYFDEKPENVEKNEFYELIHKV